MHDIVNTLSEIILDYDVCRNMKVVNYNGKVIGTYHVGVFLEALKISNTDFMVSKVEDNNDVIDVIIESQNDNNVDDFIYKVKQKDQEHDKLIGDGKYW